MVRCSLCEHEQDRGEACDVCGRSLLPAAALAGPIAPLEGLELHRHPRAPDVVGVEPLDVERTAEPRERSAPRDEIPTCRHCGELVPSGEAFCLRCGMHAVAVARTPEPPEARARCRQCGVAAPGERCPSCGARLPAPEGG